MTLLPVTDRREIEAAYGAMTKRLQAGTQVFDRKIGFHGGYNQEKVYWHDALDFWWLLNRTVAGNRWWCCYGTENPSIRTCFPSPSRRTRRSRA